MTTLEELARNKFQDPPLSVAEERVVLCAPDGTIADCCDLGGGSDPEKADGSPEAPNEKWPETRNVRADLIRWLCIAREARDQVDPRGVWIRGCRISDSIDLRFTTVRSPLALLSCRLEQPLILQGAKMIALSLDGSWTGPIFADGLNVDGGLFLRNGFHADGVVRLPGATIESNLEATGGTFNNPTGYALFADHIKVRGSILLRQELQSKGAFKAAGEVRLLGAAIGGNLDAEGATVKSLKSDNLSGHALNADRAKIEGSVLLTQGFSAEGEVRLLNATVKGDLNATGGTFKTPNGNALSADGINVSGSIYLKGGFVAVGYVRLPGARIVGQMVVDDARLNYLTLESARIAGPFFWRNIDKDPDPRFPNKDWKPYLNLTNAKAGLLVDQEASWPEDGRLFIDGFVYDRIAPGPADAKVPIDASARLRWLRRQPDELGYLPQPYEQLITVLRRMGHEHQVAEVAIAKQKDLRKCGDLGWLGWIRSWFFYLVVGYGYRAWLAFIWILILVVLGSGVFSRAYSANVLVPSDKDAYTEYEKSKMEKLPPYYPDFHALLYSLDVVLPFDFGQKSSWRLIQRWPGDHAYWGFETYSLLQLFIGWVLLLVAAAVPAGFIKKD